MNCLTLLKLKLQRRTWVSQGIRVIVTKQALKNIRESQR